MHVKICIMVVCIQGAFTDRVKNETKNVLDVLLCTSYC